MFFVLYIVAADVREYSFAVTPLAKWLQENTVPGIFGVDTRTLTKLLRNEGAELGAVIIGRGSPCPSWQDTNTRNLVAEGSISSPRCFEPTTEEDKGLALRILAVDGGLLDTGVLHGSVLRWADLGQDLPFRRELRRAERRG